jgi:hypothetical protein
MNVSNLLGLPTCVSPWLSMRRFFGLFGVLGFIFALIVGLQGFVRCGLPTIAFVPVGWLEVREKRGVLLPHASLGFFEHCRRYLVGSVSEALLRA